MIDLHCHSTASDGTFSPAALVSEALRANLSALALTDHDTVDGVDEFMRAAEGTSLRAIPGVELASRNEKGESMHLVGLFIDCHSESLACSLNTINKWRKERNERLLANLNRLGLEITMEEVKAVAGSHVIGRPHFARVLASKKYVGNIKGAFSRYLDRGKPAYSPRQVFSIKECIDIIHQANGLAIWAHPFSNSHLTISNFRCRMNALKEEGLDGVEAYYPCHTQNQTKMAALIANSLGLLQSGGSDFHGSVFPGLNLGTAYGHFKIDDSLLDAMLKRINSKELHSISELPPIS